MKLQLIMTEPPMLLSFEKVNKGEFWYNHQNNEFGNCLFENGIPIEWGKTSKVIAGLPELPSIDLNLISEEKLKEMGYLNVEKLARSIYQPELSSISPFASDLAVPKRKAFIKGFNLANQLSKNKYSEEDIKTAIDFGYETSELYRTEYLKKQINFLEKIKQPKVYDIEIEWEQKKFKTGIEDNGVEEDCYESPEPKITNNSIKVIQIL